MKRNLPLFASLFLFSAITAAHAQSSHTVALNWTQSTSSGVTANKVYRSTTSGAQGAAIFTSASPVTTYTDGPLTNGTTYYYCVSALVGSNNESPCSNQVSAIIPAPPAAPTALTDTVN